MKWEGMSQLEMFWPKEDEQCDIEYKTLIDTWRIYWKYMVATDWRGNFAFMVESDDGNIQMADRDKKWISELRGHQYAAIRESYRNYAIERELLR
jgi:hypothetical protein